MHLLHIFLWDWDALRFQPSKLVHYAPFGSLLVSCPSVYFKSKSTEWNHVNSTLLFELITFMTWKENRHKFPDLVKIKTKIQSCVRGNSSLSYIKACLKAFILLDDVNCLIFSNHNWDVNYRITTPTLCKGNPLEPVFASVWQSRGWQAVSEQKTWWETSNSTFTNDTKPNSDCR